MTSLTAKAPQLPRRRAHRRTKALTIAAIVPALAAIAVFFGVPWGQAMVLSFTSWNGVADPAFTGLRNYQTVLGSQDFYDALVRTLIYSGGTAAGIVIVASVLAAAVSAGVAGSRFYRVIWFAPAVAPAAAVGVFWSVSFQPKIGTSNAILGALGLGDNYTWLSDTSTAMAVLIFVSIWGGVGFAFLLILGGMEQIPTSVYEAARIDGASAMRQFFSITLPLTRPVIAVTATLQLIWAFNGFTIVWGLTRGGPGDATTTLPVMVYQQAFQFFRYGESSAIAVLAGTALIAIGFAAMQGSRSRQGER